MDRGEFVRANLPPLLEKLRGHAFLKFGLQKADVDDLLQEVAVTALAKADQFTPGSNLYGWLYVIMRNGFFDRYRRAKAHDLVPIFDLEDPALVRDGAQESTVEAKEKAAVFDRLSPNFRSAMLAVAMGDSYDQAAKRIGINSGTLRSRLWRGRAQLAEAIL